MSEDEVKITSSEQPRVKDPKRVEAGKRLGAISKAAKEKKARERYNRERDIDAVDGMDWTIPIGIGAAGLIGLCYIFYRKRQPETPEQEPSEQEPSTPSREPSTRRRRDLAPVFDSLGE